MTAEERAEQKKAFQTLIGTVKSRGRCDTGNTPRVSNPHSYGQKSS